MQTDKTDTKLARFGPLFGHYDLNGAYDEMFGPEGSARQPYQKLFQRILELAPEELNQRQ